MKKPSGAEGPRFGIMGGEGMLGSDLCAFFSERGEKVDPITKENYADRKGSHYDVFINANGNSRRFWANEHPWEDFEASTVSVAKSLFDFNYGEYIYISSPDIYADPSVPGKTREEDPGPADALSPYGFHKRLSEDLVKRYAKDFIIVRPAALLGTRLKKGVVNDIFEGGELFAAPGSRVQFITTQALAEIISALLSKKISRQIFNAGGRGAVSPKEIADMAGKPARFRSDAEPQQYEMNVEKAAAIYDALGTSADYVRLFVQNRRLL